MGVYWISLLLVTFSWLAVLPCFLVAGRFKTREQIVSLVIFTLIVLAPWLFGLFGFFGADTSRTRWITREVLAGGGKDGPLLCPLFWLNNLVSIVFLVRQVVRIRGIRQLSAGSQP